MRIAILLLTSALLLRVAPLSVAVAQPVPTPNLGKVQGVVTSSTSGTPLKKATITLRNPDGHYFHEAVTDAAGHFRIDSVEPGTYQILADKPGFMSIRSESARPLSIAEGQELKDVSVKLIPYGTISGRVVDGDGEPIPFARVEAMRYFFPRGRKVMWSWQLVYSNDLGEYDLDLQPGRYYVRAGALPRHPRLPARTRLSTPETAYPVTFYPGVPDITQAVATQVAPGARIADMDIQIAEKPSYHIRGKADALTNTSLIAWPANLLGSPGISALGARVQADGTFDFRGLLSGPYLINHQSGDEALQVHRVVTVANRDLDNLVLTPGSVGKLDGLVTVEGAVPEPWKGLNISINPLSLLGQAPASRAVVESDGAFLLENLLPIAYQIDAEVKIPGKYIKSMRLADYELVGGLLDVTLQAGGKLEILLGSDGGQLQCAVETADGNPAPGAQITLAPKDEERAEAFKTASSDKDGNYTFKNLAPGDYTAFAWQDVNLDLAQSPEYRRTFANKGVSVTIPPSGQASIQLKTISADEIEAELAKLP